MKKKILYILPILSIFYLSGCLLSVYPLRNYIAPKHNIPVFKKAKQFQVSGNISRNIGAGLVEYDVKRATDTLTTMGANVSYSINDYMAVSTGYQSFHQGIYGANSVHGIHTYSTDSALYSLNNANTDYYNMSFGLFHKDTILYKSIFAGYCFANQNHHYNIKLNTKKANDDPNGIVRSQVFIINQDLDYSVYYIEPTIGWVWKYFEILLSARLSVINYHSINGDDIIVKQSDNVYIKGTKNALAKLDNYSTVSLETALTINLGLENVKLHLQVETSDVSNNSDYLFENTSFLGVYYGLIITF